MADVNFVEYGVNALRVNNSVFDLVSFFSANGYVLGVFIALVIIFGLILFLMFFLWKNFKRIWV